MPVPGKDQPLADATTRVRAAGERALVLGGAGSGLSSPANARFSSGSGALDIEGDGALGLPAIGARARQHPYVRLALNGPFSALWTGQLISLFGDRIHQIALAFMGMPFLDATDLEPLSAACAELGRYEFLLTVAPLRIRGGTGSAVNPICYF